MNCKLKLVCQNALQVENIEERKFVVTYSLMHSWLDRTSVCRIDFLFLVLLRCWQAIGTLSQLS